MGISLIIICAYVGAKLLRRISFPAVTAYLLIGILIGPHLLNLIPLKIMNASDFVSNLVLGIIAFTLGANFTVSGLKAGGKSVLWISVLEAAFAWIIVTAVMIAYFQMIHMPIHPALVLGAAASATAPAATVMVMREYRASGPVTDMLLRVVAIDDAWCLIFSALAITTANAMRLGVFNIEVLFEAFYEIFAALLLGGVLGLGFYLLSRFIMTVEEVLVIVIGSIMLAVGLAMKLNLSPLLTNITFGLVVANIVKNNDLFFEKLRNVDIVFFLGFFVLVGANLEINILPRIGIMGVLYMVFRVAGKFIGVRLGSMIAKSGKNISKYLAWGLVPQAGVALGVALSAKAIYPKYGEIIFTTITATTVIYELVGPILAKYGLKKAGEI
ncbi:MAG: cation:proton antiporter [candidate division WOR-3 bacterium]|nr:MAG: cation:proton antiporter [candidate division WOR-3 bacterium]